VGWGKGDYKKCFGPAYSAPKARLGWEAARLCVSREAKPTKIDSLIEKDFCARPLKEKEILRALLAAVRRRNAGRVLRPSGRKLLLEKGSSFVQ